MNRYAAVGMMLDALDGKRIVVLTITTREARNAFDELTAVSGDAARVRAANGAERVDYPSGGRITFRSIRQGTARLAADVLYLDEGVDAELRVPDQWSTIVACLNGSPRSEVIRA